MENYVRYDTSGRVHIGDTISNFLARNGISKSFLADQIHMSRGGFTKALMKPFMSTEVIERIVQVTNHNFFKYFSDYYETEEQPEPEPEPKPVRKKLVIELEGDHVLGQTVVSEEGAKYETEQRDDLLQRIEERQERFLHRLEVLIPEIARAMAAHPELNPTNMSLPDDEKE